MKKLIYSSGVHPRGKRYVPAMTLPGRRALTMTLTSALLAAAIDAAQATGSQAEFDGKKVGEQIGHNAPVQLDTVSVKVTSKQAENHGALGRRTKLDTPFAVESVTSDSLEERQIHALGQVFSEDASVAAKGNTYTQASYSLSVRGLPIDFSNNYKINGQPFQMYGVEMPFEDLEQVQLLKGAGGFLYGIGAPGGIINFVTKKPTESRLTSVDIGYASAGLWSEHVDLGNTVGSNGQFGYRLNLSHEQGTTYNHVNLKRNALAFSGSWQASDDLLFTVDHITQKRNIDGSVPTFDTSLYPTSSRLPSPRSGDSKLAAFDDVAYYKSTINITTASAQYRINDNWHARLDAGYTVKKINSAFERIYLTSSLGDYSSRLNPFYSPTLTYKNVQLILEGKVQSGPLVHNLVLGVADQTLDRRLNKNSNLNLYDASSIGNLYKDPPVPTLSTVVDRRSFYTISRYDTRSAFVSDTIDFGSHWSVLLGARYIDYKNRNYKTSGIRVIEYHETPVTPSAALLFKPSTNATIYASYIQALENGGTVGNTFANANQALPPIKSKQYELGFKIEKTRWQAAAAVFQVDRGTGYADYSSNALGIYSNDGRSRYRGVEASGRFIVAKGLALGASATWLDAVYKRALVSLVGNQVEGVPRWSGSSYAEWTPQWWPLISLRADLLYTGKQQVNSANNWALPSFTLVNVGASYRTSIGQHALTIRAGVNNLTNRRYWYSSTNGYVSNQIMLGAPRTLSANVRFDF